MVRSSSALLKTILFLVVITFCGELKASRGDLSVAKEIADSAGLYEHINSDTCFAFAEQLHRFLNSCEVSAKDSSKYLRLKMRGHYYKACHYGVNRIKKEMFANYREAYAIAEKINDKVYLGYIGANLGIELLIEGDHEGHQFVIKANEHALNTGDKNVLVKTQGALAFFYQMIGEYQSALKYLRLNNKMMEAGEVDFSVLTAISIGQSYLKLDRPDSAVYFLERSLLNYKELNREQYTAPVRTFLGMAYLNMNKYVEAWGHLKLAMSLFENHDQLIWPETYQFLGQTFEKMGALDSAKVFYQHSIDQSIAVKSETTIADSYESLAQVNAQLGDYKAACTAMELHIQKFESAGIVQKKNQILRNTLVFEQQRSAIQKAQLRSEEEIKIGERFMADQDEAEIAKRSLSFNRKIFFGLLISLGIMISVFVGQLKKKKNITLWMVLFSLPAAYADTSDQNTIADNYDRELGELTIQKQQIDLEAKKNKIKKNYEAYYQDLSKSKEYAQKILNRQIEGDKERIKLLSEIKAKAERDSLRTEKRDEINAELLDQSKAKAESISSKASSYATGNKFLIALIIGLFLLMLIKRKKK